MNRGYESYFRRSQRPDYAEHYVNYGLLKAKLNEFYARRRLLLRCLSDGRGRLSATAFIDLVGGDTYNTSGGMGRVRMEGDLFASKTANTFDGVLEADGGNGCEYFLHDDDEEDHNDVHYNNCGAPPLPTRPTGREKNGTRSAAAVSDSVSVDGRTAVHRMSIIERHEFDTLLELELGRAAKFYVAVLLPTVQQHITLHEYADASKTLLEAVAFAITNAITFRQIVIRYDAFCWTFDVTARIHKWEQSSLLSSSLVTSTSSSQNCHVNDVHHPVSQLLCLWGTQELEVGIIMGVQQGSMTQEIMLDNDKIHTQTSRQNSGGKKDTTSLAVPVGGMTLTDVEDLTNQVQSFRCLLEKTERATVLRGRGSSEVKNYFFRDRLLAICARIIDYLLIDLQRRGIVSLRGRHFKNEIEIIAKWRENKDFSQFSYNLNGNDGRSNLRRNLSEIKQENIVPLFLNLVSCFLFMMNSYIIEPSSAHYAEALGSKDAVAGLMLGATPLFALTSCVVYSFWTNYNYRNPLLFAGVLQFLGNFCYANAYAYQSIELCLIGRAMTGLGAPRIINRRYVADATPFKLRTMTSAAFAMAMAVGSAMGPGMAILLDMVPEFQFNLPFLKTQYFNGMTGPGYFMSLNWFVYTLCIAFFFSEPTRSGLEELKKREGKFDEVELATISSTDVKTIGRIRSGDTFDDSIQRQDSLLTSEYNPVKRKLVSGGFDCCSCIKHMTRPVVICMSLIFMKRITLESIVGSTSIITKNRYGWEIKNVGALHLANGIIVIPVSIVSGYLSTLYEDRYMMIWFMSITLIGMTFLFDPTDLIQHNNNSTYNEDQFWSVGPARYITGSLIAFSGVEACESYIASLISKVVPSALAQGTFNSGLLATLVGTSGQATGDLMIFLMGLISIRNLLNLLIIPGAILVVISILLVRLNYSLLAV